MTIKFRQPYKMKVSSFSFIKSTQIRQFHKTLQVNTGARSEQVIQRNCQYAAHNYKPIPVALTEGCGSYVFDVEGKRYLDCLAGYGAVNQGHCHPKIIEALHKQSKQLTHVSRAFYTDAMGEMAEFVTKVFGYDKFLPMNTGVEAAETCVKIARRWGYDVKKIPENQAKVCMLPFVCFSSDKLYG